MMQLQQSLHRSSDKSGSSSPITLSTRFVQISDQFTAPQWLDLAILFRIVLLLCMALSCHMFPPQWMVQDDSVVTFPLRLMHSTHLFTSEENLQQQQQRPFTLPNSICSSILRYQLVVDARKGISFTLQESNKNRIMIMSSHSSPIWSFLLTPLTRWDAARFLQLAHDPSIRYPQVQYQKLLAGMSENMGTTFMDDSMISSINNVTSLPSCPNTDQILQQSQEAHAFLPLYPLMIQVVVAILLWCAPASTLPPTCEGVVVLAATLFNTMCYLWSAKQLYHLTRSLLRHRPPNRNNNDDTPAPPPNASFHILDDESERWARRVLLLYMINPATIFFNTSYSESLAAALIFSGYRCIWHARVVAVAPRVVAWYCIVGTWVVWYLSGWVRSNGTFQAGFLFLFGMGGLLRQNKSLNHWLISISVIFGSVVLVIGSMGLYNYHAYRNHCWLTSTTQSATENDRISDCASVDGYQPPEWCQYGPYFNVYSFVQEKYWNVGLFRYYEWKQLPNFILAAPVLCCSIVAVCTWIKINWERYVKQNNIKEKRGNRYILQFVRWSIFSLQLFASDANGAGTLEMPSTDIETTLLGDPILLGHYAVLAVSTMIGLSVAHVQITTRMIFSTCPALYWYLVVIISKRGRFGDAVVLWCILYIVLGLIMHPNWLPWT